MSKRGTKLSERIAPTRLGDHMRLHRTVNQRGLREVASEIGIGHATLMRIEHGEAFDVATWLKVQAWLFGEASR